MDIITQGDFAVTNHGGRTTFSFRCPSLQQIDFTGKASSLPSISASQRPHGCQKCPLPMRKRQEIQAMLHDPQSRLRLRLPLSQLGTRCPTIRQSITQAQGRPARPRAASRPAVLNPINSLLTHHPRDGCEPNLGFRRRPDSDSLCRDAKLTFPALAIGRLFRARCR